MDMLVFCDYFLLDWYENLAYLILKPAPFYFLLKIIFGFLFFSTGCPKNIPFHFAHDIKRILQCVNCSHDRLESQVYHPECKREDGRRDHDQDS